VFDAPGVLALREQLQLPFQHGDCAGAEHNAAVFGDLRSVAIHTRHARLGEAEDAIGGIIVPSSS
jgi:hypothetical protein